MESPGEPGEGQGEGSREGSRLPLESARQGQQGPGPAWDRQTWQCVCVTVKEHLPVDSSSTCDGSAGVLPTLSPCEGLQGAHGSQPSLCLLQTHLRGFDAMLSSSRLRDAFHCVRRAVGLSDTSAGRAAIYHWVFSSLTFEMQNENHLSGLYAKAFSVE